MCHVICLTSWFYCMLHPVCNISQEPWLSFITRQKLSNRSKMIREIEMCQLVFLGPIFLAVNGEDYLWNMTSNVCNHIYFQFNFLNEDFNFSKRFLFKKTDNLPQVSLFFKNATIKITIAFWIFFFSVFNVYICWIVFLQEKTFHFNKIPSSLTSVPLSPQTKTYFFSLLENWFCHTTCLFSREIWGSKRTEEYKKYFKKFQQGKWIEIYLLVLSNFT